MSERRIYKYQGTLIGDDRVDSIDINKLNTITPYLSYNSDSSSLEIGSNLEVKGSTKFNKGITIMNELEPIITTYDIEGNPVHILLEQADTLTIYSNNGITYFPLVGADGIVVKDINLKNVFGQSIYTEDGTGSINLYVHYLSIIAGSKFYNGVIYSSNNTGATSPQGLTTLFKATPDTPLDCIILSDIDTNTVGLLKWTGDIWQIQLANDNFVTVTNVTDRVEPI